MTPYGVIELYRIWGLDFMNPVVIAKNSMLPYNSSVLLLSNEFFGKFTSSLTAKLPNKKSLL